MKTNGLLFVPQSWVTASSSLGLYTNVQTSVTDYITILTQLELIYLYIENAGSHSFLRGPLLLLKPFKTHRETCHEFDVFISLYLGKTSSPPPGYKFERKHRAAERGSTQC